MMVLKICRFSDAMICPGKGICFVRGDSQVFPFGSSKCKRYFHNVLKPAKLTLTAVYKEQDKRAFWSDNSLKPSIIESASVHEHISRPSGQVFELKRGDWICSKCSFANFARNMSCLECGETRTKRQLTGAEWECPQCDFFNYGRNISCLRCDCKRPPDVLRGSPAQEQDSNGGGSKRIGSNGTSDSISRSLDRILSRESSAGGNTSMRDSSSSSKQRRKLDSTPFVPLPPDIFTKTREPNKLIDSYEGVSPSASELIDSLVKSSESPTVSNGGKEPSDDDFPDVMPMRKGENRFVISKKKDRSFSSPAYKRRLAFEQANNYNSVPFVPFPPGYFAKKDDQPATASAEDSASLEGTGESLNKTQKSSDSTYASGHSDGLWSTKNAGRVGFSSTTSAPAGPAQHNGGYPGASLEGSLVKEIDPLDMSEEAKEERWFRRAAQIKDVSELSQIPDEDFPEIMPMRKGVNRFVVSKRKTPLQRRLTSQQYIRSPPTVSSEVDDVASN